MKKVFKEAWDNATLLSKISLMFSIFVLIFNTIVLIFNLSLLK